MSRKRSLPAPESVQLNGSEERVEARSSCPVCGSSAIEAGTPVPGKKDIRGGQLYLARCAVCGTVFQPVLFEEEVFVEWYDYMGDRELIRALSPLNEKRLRRVLRILEPCRQKNRLLEIGPGEGFFARVAASQGWKVYATEISPSCCDILRPLLGSRLYQGTLLRADFEPLSFDAVLMMEVIEHLPDPMAYLQTAMRMLRPGGCIYLTTPNLRGLSGRLFGHRWRVVADEHLNYFDRDTVKKMLHVAGFVDVVVRTTGIDTPLRHLTSSDTMASRAASVGDDVPVTCPEKKSRDLRALILDRVTECANRILGVLSIGDTLKVTARKPEEVSRIQDKWVKARVSTKESDPCTKEG